MGKILLRTKVRFYFFVGSKFVDCSIFYQNEIKKGWPLPTLSSKLLCNYKLAGTANIVNVCNSNQVDALFHWR